MLAVEAVASTGPPPAPQARRASHRLLARPQALPVAIRGPWCVVAQRSSEFESSRESVGAGLISPYGVDRHRHRPRFIINV